MHRHSSRRVPSLGKSFLAERLRGARSYDRIAGYFSSSILEVAGEELESMSGKVRIICNSELDPDDVKSARAAAMAMRREWCRQDPEHMAEKGADRFARLYHFLTSGKLEVKVLPDSAFGLIHGKAGVIEMADGRYTSFLGSANESKTAWRRNFELVWEDEDPDSIAWVREEFDALWGNAAAFPLAQAVVEDVERLSRRKVFGSVDAWKEEGDAAGAIVETPVYRREYGLWAHQKYFTKLAYDAHRTPFGARYVLADMVGLGKTIQLAMAAMLMALWGDKPILIIAPKPLLWQWQDEMDKLLGMPSAVWDGKQWVDEHGVCHGSNGPDRILKCPRRVALVSQGLFSANTDAAERLKRLEYECVVVDEAHRARRRNLAPGCENENGEHNNLLRHLHDLARRTKSLLLGTATPVQINPIEAWDLLNLLNTNREHVLGNFWSEWTKPTECLPVVSGEVSLSGITTVDFWSWFRNPVPPVNEGRDFETLRRVLGMTDDQAIANGSDIDKLKAPDRSRLERLKPNFGREHNPFLRHIIRRTRDFLETEKDPETNQPYLDPVAVKLLGEGDEGAVELSPYLKQAYVLAEDFCAAIARNRKGAGFLKTLLLRRAGSSVVAGISTARKMLENWESIEDDDEDEDEPPKRDDFKTLTPAERALLESYVRALESNQSEDPKYRVVHRLLTEGNPEAESLPWKNLGCMIFSQYYDSAEWLAAKLSKEALPEDLIGLYAGSGRSAYYRGGERQPAEREDLKRLVRDGEIKILVGTDAASEGLNLQRLGTLINLDLPWNPTRLEQRKGRIQRIGQKRDTVYVFNMRYRDSIEDRVHQMLSTRLKHIHNLFGQIPDTLESAWIAAALGDDRKARETIDAVPEKHPFEAKYNQIASINWESCSEVLNRVAAKEALERGW